MTISKKQLVRALLELTATTPNLPLNKDGHTINQEKLLDVPEINAMITLFKYADITSDWLLNKGFMPAYMLYGQFLNRK